MNIVQKNSTHNTGSKAGRKIEYIVIHYTAGVSSQKGTAINVANNFAVSTREASADFIVDDETIVQYNGNIANRYTWAVGRSKYTSKSTQLAGVEYQKCTNKNSISIEMCSSKINKQSLSASDNDWYITDAVVNNTIALTKQLMQQYNIDINHVIMHHMVTGKLCPQPWCKNDAALVNWNNFLSAVAGIGSPVEPTETATATKADYTIKVLVDELNVRKGPGNSYAVVTVIKKGQVYTIVEEQNGWGKLKSGAGWVYVANASYVQKTQAPPKQDYLYKIRVTASALNVRSGAGSSYSVIATIRDKGQYSVIEEQNGWVKLKEYNGWVSAKYTQKI